MKVQVLKDILDKLNPDAEVRIDLGLMGDNKPEIIHQLITDADMNESDIQQVVLEKYEEDKINAVYLVMQSRYDYALRKEAEAFFNEHNISIEDY